MTSIIDVDSISKLTMSMVGAEGKSQRLALETSAMLVAASELVNKRESGGQHQRPRRW
jgi:hypothetical protein